MVGAAVLGLFFCCLTGMVGPFAIEAVANLLAGWLIFPLRGVRILPLDAHELVASLTWFVLLGIIFVLRARARRTPAILAVVLLAVVGGVAFVGLARHASWLVTTKEPLTRASWPFLSEIKAWKALDEIVAGQKKFHERKQRYATLEELGEAGLVSEETASGSFGDYVFDAAPSVTEPAERWFAVAFTRRPGCRQFFKNGSGLLYQWDREPLAVDRVTCEPPSGFHNVHHMK